ncbi:M20/M25/M40 family metallo-hydrolase [Paludibaculum fermentans]|uniref:M20/M25/M40 family metallo-hydrolase n=1 Tax=Paludibaculum fermentans TaxID=1473598 RepID=A0A7S7NUR7_PALFE|nr:M20/M25/M40 family metallo-hydrolase [Paludibaculum fermentans]QOY90200.1 M20/M25/M40 family metallo-hydrolase [Paludibaculum fermentans]
MLDLKSQALKPTDGSPDARAVLDAAFERARTYLVQTLAELVRTPSENLPPRGNESACQQFVARELESLGLTPDVYLLGSVEGLQSHPEYWPDRDYSNRPNVNAVMRGRGGRSLVLSGHIDTVPADTPVEWSHPPFGGVIENGRLYGRGAWDMKAGVAMNLTVLRVLHDVGATLNGDLIFETVVDEEFGGVNGTLAARLRGYTADAAIITEPTFLKICPAQRGGQVVHVDLRGGGGILSTGEPAGRVTEQLAHILAAVPAFARERESRVAIHPYYAGCVEPFAAWVTNIATGNWGWTQPISIAERCRMEIYFQTMPDETGDEARADFQRWWDATLDARPDLFRTRPAFHFPMRWLPGCSLDSGHSLVTELQSAARSLGHEAHVEGLDAPSDMYIFQRCFQVPAVMWGPSGGNAHQADEFVDVESLEQAARVLLQMVQRWCGVEVPSR